MLQTHTLREKFTQFFHIFIPIFITQIGLSSINFFDTTMSGKFSAEDLAGVAIGSSIWVPVYTGLTGILLSITPIAAQLLGAKKQSEVSYQVKQGLYLGIIMALAVFVIGSFGIKPILNAMNIEPVVRDIAKNYLIALSFGIVPLFLYQVIRCFIDSLGQTKVSMMITLLSIPINVSLNYLFIFGKFGFPALGGVGAGVASAITYWFVLGIAIWIVQKKHPFSLYKIFSALPAPSLKSFVEILKIGIPIGFAIFFEVSIFSAVTLLMSNYDTMTIAAHQAAMNFSAVMFMFPLSISMALTIVVGFEVGAKRLHDAFQYSWLGISFAVCMAFVSSFILYQFREDIAAIYTENPIVLELTANFLLFAILFQLSDALQAPIQGALRGYKDVNVTFWICFFAYWIVGLPAGYLLAEFTSLEAYGYWIGLTIGLSVGALLLGSRLYYIQKRKRASDVSSFS
ncbi:MATE family multidrug resistance protein [Bacillus oleivorans]|uniref:Probable multidrug resistance protein NorM n=1 Tax=Bacillus oleivorans TaxID=1448271 RepID=A0A285CLS6_9BACI|nr:MATE family efflux transporter [Bacillus oleivorans]SNX68365.1 MATE family multidrug resistance protein [Bacillus oleivorans]